MRMYEPITTRSHARTLKRVRRWNAMLHDLADRFWAVPQEEQQRLRQEQELALSVEPVCSLYWEIAQNARKVHLNYSRIEASFMDSPLHCMWHAMTRYACMFQVDNTPQLAAVCRDLIHRHFHIPRDLLASDDYLARYV